MSKVRSVFAALCFSLLVGSAAAFIDYGGAGGGGGSGVSSWNDLQDVPAGFSDGVDDTASPGNNPVSDDSAGSVYVTTTTNSFGIGTTAPTAKLNVIGNAVVSTSLTASTATLTGSGFSVGTSTFVVKAGKVGIGTTAPAYDLDIAAGTMRIRKASPSVNFLTFDSNLGAGPSASPIISFERQGVQYASMTVSDVGNVGFSFFGGKTRIVSNGMIFESDGNLLAARGSLDILGYGTNSYALSVSTAFNTYDFVVTTTNKVGVGTSNPSYKFHSVSDAATSGTIFAVSTGTVDLFAVHGTSVSLEVPLVFPDGTVQVTADTGSGSGGGDNFGSHTATRNVVMQNFAITGVSSMTATLVYGSAANMTSIPGPQVTGLLPSSVFPSTSVFSNSTTTITAGRVHTSFFTVRSSTMHITAAAGASVNTPMFAVSTGPVNVFSVLGGSVNLKVPLVFPDGSIQTSASAPGTGDIESVTAGTNLTGGGTTGSVTLNLADTIVLSSVTATGDLTFYGLLKGTGSGGGTFEFTSTTGTISNSTNKNAVGIMNSSVTINNNQIVAMSTSVTVSANFKSTGTVSAVNIDPVLWTDITISSDSLAAGGTFWMLTAPSNSAITITSIVPLTYSVAASSANFSLQEKVTQNANGSQIFTGTYSTGTWNHMNPITSFADSSIAAGSSVFLVTKDGGAIAGTPRALSVILYYKYATP